MDTLAVKNILTSFHNIAVVGISAKPERPSNRVAQYLIQQGYTVYPVNPGLQDVLGLPCYSSLSSIPPEVRKNIEIVNIFRKSEDVPPIVDEAIALGAKAIWMQLGISNDAAASKARNAGLQVIENQCIAVVHQQLFH